MTQEDMIQGDTGGQDIDDMDTKPVTPVSGGYYVERTPRDPYVVFVASLVLFAVSHCGGVEDMNAEQLHAALDGLLASGAVLGAIAVKVWRRRVGAS